MDKLKPQLKRKTIDLGGKKKITTENDQTEDSRKNEPDYTKLSKHFEILLTTLLNSRENS